MSLVLTNNATQQSASAQASITARLDTAQTQIRHAQKGITLHEGRTLDVAISDDLWHILESANTSLEELRGCCCWECGSQIADDNSCTCHPVKEVRNG